jgi:aminopeptidase N
LKAPYELLVLCPDDWIVTSTSQNKPVTSPSDSAYSASLKYFNVEPKTSDLVTCQGEDKHICYHFEKSVAISTYLYSMVGGPYDVHVPEESQADPKIPMRLLCRKSLSEHVAKMKDDWFRITKKGIAFYEVMFSTPYPFGKLDQVFCADYQMGAMENVGNITYNDDYVSRGEKRTRSSIENTYNTILHEISHMWFGNLVTMQWWDDLWLNESFANMISYMAMDEAEGLEDLTLAWNIFLDENYWGLRTDQKDTSHPIAASCASTGDAEDIFDGISYGKGASFLHQLVYFFGKDVLKEGLKTYFAKYSFKNTVLSDFIAEMAEAQKTLKIMEGVSLADWAETWLNTAGCNELAVQFDASPSGEITKFEVAQSVYNKEKTPENRLRAQRFNIAAFDKDMKII